MIQPTQRRHPNVVNLNEIEPTRNEKGSRFASATRWLGRATGARGIGCSWFEVPPGKTAFPLHYHCANEEAMFILEGEGTLRIGKDTVPVSAGDYITFPTGPDSAHQLTNTGTAPLRYLAMSTLITTEIVGYPDSGKIGVSCVALEPTGPKPIMRALYNQSAQVTDYYAGEKVD